MSSDRFPLSDLVPGMKAVITDIGQAPRLLRRRLIDFGVMEGASVSVIKKLPLRGPVEIECNGQLLALRHRDCRTIEVRVP